MNKITKYKIESKLFNSKFNSFSMMEGELYFLLGVNGVGKTTLLNKLANDTVDHVDYEIANVVKISRSDVIKAYEHINLDNDELLKIVSANMKESVYVNTVLNSKETKIDTLDMEKMSKEIIAAVNKKYEVKIKELNREFKNRKKIVIKFLENEKNKFKNFLERKYSFFEAIQISSPNLRFFDPWEKPTNKKFLEFVNTSYGKIINFIKELKMEKSPWINYNNSGTDYIPFINMSKNNIPEIEIVHTSCLEQSKITKEFNESIRELHNKYNEIVRDTRYYHSATIGDIIYRILPTFHRPEKIHSISYYNKKSLGESVMEELNKVFDKYKNFHKSSVISLDETFNNLDSKNTKIMIDKFKELPISKIIATHSSLPIKHGKIENIILMWDENEEKCIANFSNLKNMKKHDDLIKNHIFEQTIQTLYEFKDKKVLFVEGFYDKKYLERFLSKDIVIIPIGGTHYAELAVSLLYNSEHGQLKFLFDNDEKGRKACKSIGCINYKDNITKNIYGDTIGELEVLISGMKKKKSKKDIVDGKYDKQLKKICHSIEKQYIQN